MGVISTATGSPAVACGIGALSIVSAFIPKVQGVLLFSNISPDVSALSAYAGKFQKKIYRKFENSLDFFKDLNTYYNVKSATNLTKLAVNGEPRPFTGIFSPPSGDIVYSDQKLTVDKWQRDFQVMPDNYRGTYLEDLRGAGENANNMNFPSHVFDAVAETLAGNINDVVPWHGVGVDGFEAFNPATAYAVGAFVKYTVGDVLKYYEVKTLTIAGETPISAPDKFISGQVKAITEGLGTKLRKARTNGLIPNVASTGVITKADAYEQLLSVWYEAPEWVKIKGGTMRISYNVLELLLASFQDISKYTEKDGTLTYLPLTNKKCKLLPCSWITKSDMVTVSPDHNLLAATDLESDYRVIRTIPQMFHLDYSMTGVLGFGIQDFDVLSINDRN
ncbi:hypothetical protein GCM10011418_38890 [Sphingobacterium alkalisoli]|nr:hypothetical protein GCM10011418_38890 [Sphingobacterium alkalisoli]